MVGSIERKKRALNNSIGQRKIDRELNNGSVPKWFLYLTLWMIPCVLYVGVFLGSSNPVLDTEVNESMSIDGYKFFFVSEKEDKNMEGNNGYTYLHSKNIWLNKKLLEEKNFKQLKMTCEHEVAHSVGIPGENHDIIEIYEKQVDTPVCNKLLDNLTY